MSVKKLLYSVLRTGKAHAPGALMIIGTGLEIYAIYTAVKDAPECMRAIDTTKREIAKVKKCRDDGEITIEQPTDDPDAEGEYVTKEYSQKDYNRDLTAVYARGVGRTAKSLKRPIITGVTGLVCFWVAYRITIARLAAATAWGAYISQQHNDYRSRVIKDLGEEKDREYLYGLKKETVEVTDEEGNTVKEDRYVLDDSVDADCPLFTPFTVKIDSRNLDYKTNMCSPIYVHNWLSICWDAINRIYHEHGYIYAYECLDVLGINESNNPDIDPNVIHQYGKILPKDNDDYIDMGCFGRDEHGNKVLNLTTDSEGNIYLTFNFDPIPITGRIPKKKDRLDTRTLIDRYPDIEK